MTSLYFFEPIYIYHALGLSFFLALGAEIRKRNYALHFSNVFVRLFLAAYIFYVLLLFIFNLHLPRITYMMSVFPYEVPLFIIGGITGSAIICYVGWRISSNLILEFLGKNSLIIYLTHWVIIKAIIAFLLFWGIDLELYPLVSFVSVGVIAICICSLLAFFFNYKPLRWLVGK